MSGDFKVTVEFYSGGRLRSDPVDLTGVPESDRRYVLADSARSQLAISYHAGTDRHGAMVEAQRALLAAEPGVTVVAVRCEDA